MKLKQNNNYRYKPYFKINKENYYMYTQVLHNINKMVHKDYKSSILSIIS